jgi:hypothetical protein
MIRQAEKIKNGSPDKKRASSLGRPAISAGKGK